MWSQSAVPGTRLCNGPYPRWKWAKRISLNISLLRRIEDNGTCQSIESDCLYSLHPFSSVILFCFLQFDCVIRKAFLDMLSGSGRILFARERVVFLYQIFTPRGEVKVWNFLFGSVIFLLCFDCFWFRSFWLKLKVEIVYYYLGLAGSFVVGESNNFKMFLIWSWLGNLFGNKKRAQNFQYYQVFSSGVGGLVLKKSPKSHCTSIVRR